MLVDDADAADRLVIHARGWAPVVYEQRGQVDLVDAVFARFEDELDEVRRLRATGSATTRQYLVALRTTLEAAEEALLLIKHPGFREELETRHCTVVVADEDRRSAPASVARFRHSSYGMTPFLRLTGGDDGVSDAVTETPRLLPIRAVSMSPSPNGAASVQSLEALLFSHGLGDVPVCPSEIPFRT